MKVYVPFRIVPHFFLFPPLLPLHSLLPVTLLFDTVVIFVVIFDSDWNPHQVGEQEGQLCHVINYYFNNWLLHHEQICVWLILHI